MEAHPWLRPLWRRVAVIAFCALWVAVEAWHDPNGIWFWLIVAITAWGGYDFFLSGKYRETKTDVSPGGR